MLLALAWKNIWRNKKRSMILLAAIALGLWGGLFSGAVMMGMGESIVNTAIDRDLAHIQIHAQNFSIAQEITNTIPDAAKIMEKIATMNGVKGVSGRTLIQGMAASPASSFGVRIAAIRPQKAGRVTTLHEKIIEGSYFKTDHKNQIIIGQKLAKRLNLKLHSKIVLGFQGLDGSLVNIACRVVGIFKTESALFDEMNVFILQDDLFRILETTPVIHEIAVRTESVRLIEPVYDKIRSENSGLSVQTWKEIAPEIAYLSQTMVNFTYFFVGLILFALLFGITNTMLMSVMDRIRELGVLTAVGMKKSNLFFMILLETVFLSITGGIGGIVLGTLTIRFFSVKGIDMSGFSSSVESFGAGAHLYPFLPTVMYLILTCMIIVAANIAALLPAWKAVHIRPSEAIRTY